MGKCEAMGEDPSLCLVEYIEGTEGQMFEGKDRLTKVYPDSIVSLLDFLEEYFLGVLCDYFLELLGCICILLDGGLWRKFWHSSLF